MLSSPKRLRRAWPMVVLLIAGVVTLYGASARCQSQSLLTVPQDCTVFYVTDGETVLVGNNEDQDDAPVRVWFLPAEPGKHGRYYIGLEDFVQGGMNDQGLFYDSLAAPHVDVATSGDRSVEEGMWTLRAMETCSTVADVVEMLDRIEIPGTWTDQLFFGDRLGNAMVVAGDGIVFRTEDALIRTNVSLTETNGAPIRCERYLQVQSMLGQAASYSEVLCRDILDATHAEWPGGAGTVYSTVYNLCNRRITCYLFHDFEHPIVFDLAEELSLGPHAYDLADLIPRNTGYETWATPALAEAQREIDRRIDPSVDLETMREWVGGYCLDLEAGFFARPPVVVRTASIATRGEELHLMLGPGGCSFRLWPASDDEGFHVNISPFVPNIDLDVLRDETGVVTGIRVVLHGMGTLPFRRIQDRPFDFPLPAVEQTGTE